MKFSLLLLMACDKGYLYHVFSAQFYKCNVDKDVIGYRKYYSGLSKSWSTFITRISRKGCFNLIISPPKSISVTLTWAEFVLKLGLRHQKPAAINTDVANMDIWLFIQ